MKANWTWSVKKFADNYLMDVFLTFEDALNYTRQTAAECYITGEVIYQ